MTTPNLSVRSYPKNEAPNDEAMAKFVMTLGSFGNIRTTVMGAWDESEHLPIIRDLPGWIEAALAAFFVNSHHSYDVGY